MTAGTGRLRRSSCCTRRRRCRTSRRCNRPDGSHSSRHCSSGLRTRPSMAPGSRRPLPGVRGRVATSSSFARHSRATLPARLARHVLKTREGRRRLATLSGRLRGCFRANSVARSGREEAGNAGGSAACPLLHRELLGEARGVDFHLTRVAGLHGQSRPRRRDVPRSRHGAESAGGRSRGGARPPLWGARGPAPQRRTNGATLAA